MCAVSVPQLGREARYSAAWDAFANEDRTTRAPAALESRVRRAAAARAVVRLRRRWNRVGVFREWRPAALAAAGGLALSAGIGGGLLWPASRPQVRPTPRDSVVPERVPAVVDPPSVAAGAGPRATRRAAPARVLAPDPGPAGAEPPAAAGATPAPAEPRESLQMVRLRMPLSELEALGVRLSDGSRVSQGGGWVDVDVVVGLDGWPRDVLRIASVDPGEL